VRDQEAQDHTDTQRHDDTSDDDRWLLPPGRLDWRGAELLRLDELLAQGESALANFEVIYCGGNLLELG
jgi:hypothetical protein